MYDIGWNSVDACKFIRGSCHILNAYQSYGKSIIIKVNVYLNLGQIYGLALKLTLPIIQS